MNITSLGTAPRGKSNILAAAATLITAAVILAFSAVMTVSAQSEDPDWKMAPTGLNVAAGDAAGELEITWDPQSQTSKTLQDYRVTWTPDGEAFRPNSETDWYAYPTTNQVTVTGLELGFGVHAGQAVDGGAGGADIAINHGFCPCPKMRGFWYSVNPAPNPWFWTL